MDMASPPDAGAGRAVTFGPFRLVAAERLLERDARRIVLGSRALDVLIHLVANAGQTVNKKALIASVWAGVEISESVLRVHIATLRKILQDGHPDSRYITNVAGQGYCFVAPVAAEHADVPVRAPTPPRRAGVRLPAALTSVIGREMAIEVVRTRLLMQRFVTIVGPGGIGKTTVAVSVAHAMCSEIADAAFFVDLGALGDAARIVDAMADAIGLAVDAARDFPAVLAFLKDRHALLVLDTCEHLVDAVAPLAERIFQQAPGVRILATSREALRVDGETVYRLAQLAMPVGFEALAANDLRKLSAVALFLERSHANGADAELADHQVATVARICKRLDGNALAIEIAGGFAGEFGIDAAAELTQDPWRLLRQQGRRTAPPRQLTLNALFGWSYALLPDYDRVVLRRLAVFAGRFDHDAAHAIVEARGTPENVMAALGRLVALSLLSTQVSDTGAIRYQLLEMSRAFALDKLDESGDRALATERYAVYCALHCDGRAPRTVPSSSSELGASRHAAHPRVFVPAAGDPTLSSGVRAIPTDRG